MAYNLFKRNSEIRWLTNRYKTVRDKIIKAKSSITFLIKCRNAGIIPKFIANSTKNLSSLFGEMMINKIQNSLMKFKTDMDSKILNLIIKQKHEILKLFQGELKVIEYNIKSNLSRANFEKFLDFELKIGKNLEYRSKKIHMKKFNCLLKFQREKLGMKVPEKWFVNKTNIVFPEDVQWTLSLGQKHALPIKRENFPTLKFIADAEELVQTIENKEEQEVARTQLTTIIDSHLNRIRLDNRDKFLLNRVKETERFLNKNRDIIILKADKGNTTVALSRLDYNVRINNIIGDENKYKLVNNDPTNKLQKMNNELVEELFRNKIITTNEKNKLKTYTAIAPRLYGLPKIHKDDFPLRPICSFINSPSYELCKYMAEILKVLTDKSIYNVKNSIQFKEKIKNIEIDDDEKLVSLDVVSLFPSVPIDLAMDTIEGKWDMIKNHTNIKKTLFLRILRFCIEQNRYFRFNGNVFIQHEGLPMGSPASPIIADIVMEVLLDSCIGKLDIKPKFITKYVDDLFCIISENGIDKMLEEMNSFCPCIKFTIEKESNMKLPYLDTLLIRKGKRIAVDWYQKSTSSGRIINYFSKHNRRVIINTAKNLIDRVLKISDKEFHRTNKIKVRSILVDNSFPVHLANRLIKQFRYTNVANSSDDNGNDGNNIGNTINNSNNGNNSRVEDTSLMKSYKSIIYIPRMSERLERAKIYNNVKYKIAYKVYNTLGRLFGGTKDKIEKWDRSNLVYKIPCKGNDNERCDKVYVGTTKNKLKTRIAGHKTDQKYRNINSAKTALSSHCYKFNHFPNFEKASILNTEHNYKKRLLLEMLQIISVPTTHRINFKTDTDNIAQVYRHLINKK